MPERLRAGSIKSLSKLIYMATKIEWTEATWNPVVGCDKVSEGCKNCYAIRLAYRLMHLPATKEKYAGTVERTASGNMNWTGKINIDRASLGKPFTFSKPTTFFVNSMSDLFHEEIDISFSAEVFAVMFLTPQHTYQVLTKRAEKMQSDLKDPAFMQAFWKACNYLHDKYINPLEQEMYSYEEVIAAYPLKNVWLGVSVENQKTAAERIPYLLKTPASIRFLSCEPLLGPVDLEEYYFQTSDGAYPFRGVPESDRTKWLDVIDWVIAGGESGKGSRPAHPDWFRSLRDQCAKYKKPFFFKQWGEWRIYDHWAEPCDNTKPLGQFYGNEFKYGNFISRPGMNDVCMAKVGKKISGRVLDGKTHDKMPNISK